MYFQNIENKKTNDQPCSDVVDECDSSVGLLCQGMVGSKKCSGVSSFIFYLWLKSKFSIF